MAGAATYLRRCEILGLFSAATSKLGAATVACANVLGESTLFIGARKLAAVADDF